MRDEVTPRFPDGLTVWEADGQWRRPDGSIGRERAKVLLIVHDEKPVTLAGLGALVTTLQRKVYAGVGPVGDGPRVRGILTMFSTLT